MLYVVLTVGETKEDPEAPDGEKPVPLQEVALVDVHVSVDEAPGATLGPPAPNESSGAPGERGRDGALINPPGKVVVEGYLPPCSRVGHWAANDHALVAGRLGADCGNIRRWSWVDPRSCPSRPQPRPSSPIAKSDGHGSALKEMLFSARASKGIGSGGGRRDIDADRIRGCFPCIEAGPGARASHGCSSRSELRTDRPVLRSKMYKVPVGAGLCLH